MSTGARTLSIEETLLEPQALPPPPTRHALLVILIALAALLHIASSSLTRYGSGGTLKGPRLLPFRRNEDVMAMPAKKVKLR